MKKSVIWMCVGMMLLAISSVRAEEMVAQDEESVVEEEAMPETTEAAPVKASIDYSEIVSIGVCIAKGAGLGGAVINVRPLDALGFEFDIGNRMFIYQQIGDSSSLDVYWPLMWTAKAQIFFSPNARRIQYGVELGYMSAEDMGAGAEVSGVFRFRINQHWTVDANLGLGYFIDHEDALYEYMAQVGGHDRDYYERYLDTSSVMPIALMGGVGINFAF